MTQARVGTRVAVVQLACHPAAVLGSRSPLEDPLFSLKDEVDTLPTPGAVPEALADRIHGLRERVRTTYCRQLLVRVNAILAACRAWGVQILVFPEYSIPWQILDEVAAATGDLVIVAGTHTVTRESRRSDVYRRLGGAAPGVGEAVAPVLHRGKLLGLQPKLLPAKPEAGSMTEGAVWAPIELPPPLPSPLGVLICLDLLVDSSDDPEANTRTKVGESRLLAVPSWTPGHTLREFDARAWVKAARHRTPVLYCNVASEGGTTIFVGDAADEAHRYPDQVGRLGAGEEGVVIADLDLRDVRRGELTLYEWRPRVTPVALASLVYLSHPVARDYARWLESHAPRLARTDYEAVDELLSDVADSRGLLQSAGRLPGANSRAARLRRLIGDAERINHMAEIARLVREVIVPDDAIPFPMVRAAMARGAALAIEDWLASPDIRAHQGLLITLRERLDAGGRAATEPEREAWTESGLRVLGAVAAAVRGTPPTAPAPEIVPATVEVPALPTGLDPLALPDTELDLDGAGPRRLVFRDSVRAAVAAAHSSASDTAELAKRWPARLRLDGPEVAYAEQLLALLRAESAPGQRLAAVALGPTRDERGRLFGVDAEDHDVRVHHALAVISHGTDGWVLHRATGLADHGEPDERRRVRPSQASLIDAGLARLGIRGASWREVASPEVATRIAALRSRLAGVERTIGELVQQRLRWMESVAGDGPARASESYVDPDLRNAETVAPAAAVLDGWLDHPGPRVALLLGGFGTGKSTLLAHWCRHRWRTREQEALPILVNLAGAGEHADALALLLAAAGLPDSSGDRAAVKLLIDTGHAVPCFDGFDEMATRIDAATLAGRLTSLTALAGDGGRVLVSSRTHYFPEEAQLREVEQALAASLAQAGAHVRLEVQPFDDAHVERLVRDVVGPALAEQRLRQIETTYDLRDLSHRPLLLAMVLQTIDTLSEGKRVTQAVLYERYLERWLANTHVGQEEVFSDAQKRAFAEALAEALWTTGSSSLGWDALQHTVRARLFRDLPAHARPSDAMFEIAGGAFFVRDADDQFRFAHKSFLEYFLARGLVRNLAGGSTAVLSTRPLSREVIDFVYEVLIAEGGEPRQHPAVAAVRAWLTTGRTAEDEIETSATAAANALRFLHGLARACASQGWVPDGADLRRCELVREDLSTVELRHARLDDADLSICDLSGAQIQAASLIATRLTSAILDGASFAGATLRGARMLNVRGRVVDLSGSDLRDADLARGQWIDCRWHGSRQRGARADGGFCRGSSAELPRLPEPKLRLAFADGHRREVNSVAWSRDGTRFASGGDDGTVRVWEAASGREVTRLAGHRSLVWSVTWSGDGTRLASGGADGVVRVWDAASGREVTRLDGHGDEVTGVAWSWDGNRLASSGDDGTVRVWDVASGREVRRLVGHGGGVRSVAWSSDGTRLASGGYDGTLQVWEAASWREVGRLEGHVRLVWSVAWSGDGTRLASGGSDGTVRVWEVESGRELMRLEGHRDEVNSVAWSSDGTRLASGGDDGTVRVWEAASGREVTRLEADGDRVWSVAWSEDGTRLASGGADGGVRVWEAASGREVTRLEGRGDWLSSVAWSEDGTRLASGGADGMVRVWEAASGREVARLEGPGGPVWSVAWSRDGTLLASAGVDGTVGLWEAASGRELTRLVGHGASVRSVAWSGDGTRLASGGYDGTVRVWEVASGRELTRLEGHGEWTMSVAWSGDGTRLASGGADGTVRVWEAASGRELTRLKGHGDWVRSVAWSRDGARLASGGDDGMVRVWEAASGREVRRLESQGGSVMSVAWSRDGTRLASGGADGTVRVWEAASGREVRQLEGHRGEVSSVAWSGDGTRLASGGEDDTVRIWRAVEAAVHAPDPLLVALHPIGGSSLALLPGGHGAITGPFDDRICIAMTASPPTSATLFAPLGALRPIFDRPDLVRRALAGESITETPADALRALGWEPGPAWDGGPVVLDDASPSPEASATPPPESTVLVGARAETMRFLPGRPLSQLDALPGRADVERELLELCHAQMPAALLAPRRAGKTSLLHTLARRLAPTHDVHLCSLEGARLESRDHLAVCMVPALAAASSPADALRRLSSGRPQVFLLDELAWLTKVPPDHLAWLRAVGQDTGAVVLAGSRQDWTLLMRHARQVPGSSFGNDVSIVRAGPLTIPDAIEFLTSRAPADVQISPEIARAAAELGGGWPFYLQVFGFSLVQEARAGRPVVTREQLRELRHRRLLVDRSQVFEGRWHELPELVRATLLNHLDKLPALQDLDLPVRDALMAAGLTSEAGAWLEDPPFFAWIRLEQAQLRARAAPEVR